MPAVVVEHRGDEVQLDVGTFVRRERRAQEAAAFGDVAGAGAGAVTQEIVVRDLEVADAIVGDRLRRVAQRADVQVILQVRADAGGIVDDRDVVAAQLMRGTNAGKHQQLR
jgi:hypothetical protein